MRKITKAGLGLALASGLALTGCSAADLDGGSGNASENMDLVLYSTMTENDLNALDGMLKAEFPGIYIEVVSGNAGELTTRIQSESGNPQGDMMWGGLDTADGDKHSEIFEHWLSEYESELLPEYQSPNGFYNVDHLSSVAFAVNPELEKELGIEINGYEDLLNPALKGKVLMADPTSSSSAWNNISNIMAVFGNDSDEAWDYIEALLRNDLVIASSSSAAFASVADGEYVAGLTYEDGIASLIKSGADNLKLVYPSEGTSASAFATAVIKGGPNPELAKKVITYIMSPEGQIAFAEAVGTVRMTTAAPYETEFLPSSESVKWVERDVAWLTENRPAIVDRWIDVFTEVRG
jgi:iron(III) transport system substrate-binding protein